MRSPVEILLDESSRLDRKTLSRILYPPKIIDPRSQICDIGPLFFALTPRNDDLSPIDKIIELGSAAVPDLVRYVGDHRRTADTWGSPWGSLRSSPIIDPKLRKKGIDYPLAESTSTPDYLETFETSVGDIAYFALGQIVNRNFFVGSGFKNIRVSSPVLNDRYRKQLAREWTKLTSDQLKDLLLYDIFNPDNRTREAWAVTRFVLLYSQDAESIVIRKLDSLPPAEELPTGFVYNEPSLVLAFADVQSRSIDDACFRLLIRIEATKQLRETYSQVTPDILARLLNSDLYRTDCESYARRRIADGEDINGSFGAYIKLVNRNS